MSFDTIKPKRFVKINRRHYNNDSVYVSQSVEERPSKKFTSTKRLAASTFLFMMLQMLSPFGMFADVNPVAASVPADAAVDVAINVSPVISFNAGDLTDITAPNLAKVQLRKYSDDSEITAVKTADSAGTPPTITINPDVDLENSTQYYLYIDPSFKVGANVDFNTGWDTTDKAGHEFTTVAAPDTTPPSWTATYPKVDTATGVGFTIKASIDEDGVANYVVLANDAITPSVQNVLDGKASDGTTDALKSGSIALTADTEGTTVVTGLDDKTDYDIYLVAQDDETTPNVQAAVSSKLEIQTLDVTAPVLAAVSATRSTNTSGQIVFSTDEAGEYFYEIVDAGTTPEPTVDTSGTGTAATVGENTIPLTLTTGAKDVYIAVKDASNNVSNQLKVTVDAKTYTVTFDSDGGTVVNSQTIEHGEKVAEPVDPTNVGFAFVGWVIDTTTTFWDFTVDVVTAPLDLLATWVDVENPVVTVTAPTNNTVVKTGAFTLTATATDNVGVTKVEFYKDNVKLGEDVSAPYSLSVNTREMTNAGYIFKAKAYDAEGNNALSSQVVVVVENDEINPWDKTVTKDGVEINFTTSPSNLETGFNLAVSKPSKTTYAAPKNKLVTAIYSITPSKTLEGTFSATIKVNYPEGAVWKPGDLVMYWNGSAWSSEGITVVGYNENSITFTTNHFTDFGVISDGLGLASGATELPRTGLSAELIAKIALNIALSIAFVLVLARASRRSKLGFILN